VYGVSVPEILHYLPGLKTHFSITNNWFYYCVSYALHGICHGRVSVTSQSSTKMAERRIDGANNAACPGTLVF